MPNILLVQVQILMKLMQKNLLGKLAHVCVAKRIPTNLRKSVKLLYITCSALNMFVGK